MLILGSAGKGYCLQGYNLSLSFPVTVQTPDEGGNDEKAKRGVSVRRPLLTVRFTCMEVSQNLTEDLQQM